MDKATLVRLGTPGISIQPASSKNHERRSTLMNKSWLGENRCNGSVNSPANGWHRSRALPVLRFVAQSNTSRSAERLGRQIWHARVRPSESRPKMKNLFLRIRNGSAEKRRSTSRLSRARETE